MVVSKPLASGHEENIIQCSGAMCGDRKALKLTGVLSVLIKKNLFMQRSNISMARRRSCTERYKNILENSIQ